MYASIFINTTSKKTIQVGMQDFVGQYSVEWGLLMSSGGDQSDTNSDFPLHWYRKIWYRDFLPVQ